MSSIRGEMNAYCASHGYFPPGRGEGGGGGGGGEGTPYGKVEDARRTAWSNSRLWYRLGC